MIISFVVVAYNEEKTLPRLLNDLCAQDYPHEDIEVLLIDSMSTDGTRRIMEDFAGQDNGFMQVLVLENPGKTLPYGCNVALKNYAGDVIVRLDGHAVIPTNFLSSNAAVLESGENISGGRVESILENDTPLQRTLLIAENSVFCGGVASFRRLNRRAYVNTLAFAAYRREVYDCVGLYNELLARTEDNEMHYRIDQAGFRFCLDPRICSARYTRSSFGKLLRQKYLNGYWIGKTMAVCPRCFSIYHFVPFAFVLGILITTVLALCGYPRLCGLMWGAYGLAELAATVLELVRHPFDGTHFLLPILFFLLHISYGTGTLVGLTEAPFWIRNLNRTKENS